MTYAHGQVLLWVLNNAYFWKSSVRTRVCDLSSDLSCPLAWCYCCIGALKSIRHNLGTTFSHVLQDMTDATGRQAAADLVADFLQEPSRYVVQHHMWCHDALASIDWQSMSDAVIRDVHCL